MSVKEQLLRDRLLELQSAMKSDVRTPEIERIHDLIDILVLDITEPE